MTAVSLHILHVSPSFYPAIAYGGPIFSTKAITDGISRSAGFTLEVLSTDTADPNSGQQLDLPENPMTLPAGYAVRYCRSRPGTSISAALLWRLWGAVRRADVVHLTGPYNFPVIPTLIACRMTGTPLVWSPRGGFQATAQWSGAPKQRMKNVFEKLCGKLRPRGLVLHVTSEVEATTSVRNLGDVACALIPNAIDIPDNLPERAWQPEGRLRLGFLSRVHPKKGLDLLIAALEALPDHVTLDIYGDGDHVYIEGLRADIAARGLSARVAFHGHVEGSAKSAALTNCDLFILPTYSENFGIVVAEALAHGTPVVTTHGAPWTKIEIEDCGRWTEISAQALAKAITALDGADLEAMGCRGRALMLRDFSTVGMVRRFEELYQSFADGPVS
jgi:glycosyltransferase involved in cell wall biosynthesis